MLVAKRHGCLSLIILVSVICAAPFVAAGCQRTSKWYGHTLKITYIYEDKTRVLRVVDTGSNREINDPRLKKQVTEEADRVLPCWLSASKLKRATGTFHVRFLAEGEPEIVESLDGWDSVGPEFIKDPDVTPLMIAAHEGHVEHVEQLVKQGQKVNATDQLGVTALMAAVASRNVETVRFLLDQGADVNARTVDGETAIGVAAFSRQLGMMNELGRRGAVFDCENRVDRETLLGEERRGNLRTVSALKRIGVHCTGVMPDP